MENKDFRKGFYLGMAIMLLMASLMVMYQEGKYQARVDLYNQLCEVYNNLTDVINLCTDRLSEFTNQSYTKLTYLGHCG